MRKIDWMSLSDDELAALTISTARSGVKLLEAAGVDPGEALRARASGDPDQIAAYVADHRRSPADAAGAPDNFTSSGGPMRRASPKISTRYSPTRSARRPTRDSLRRNSTT
jgi:hypothetical protein